MFSAIENRLDGELRVFHDSGLMSRPHFHKPIELVFVVEGKVEAIADGKRHKMKKGDLFVAFPNQVHYYENCDYGEYRVIILDTKYIYNFNTKTNHKKPKTNVIKNNSDIYALIAEIYDAYHKNDEISTVAKICLLVSSFLSQSELVERDKHYDHTLRNILRFCDCNFSSEISLDYIAEALNLSKYYISHTINNKLGMNFSQYISSLRITEAMRLIHESEMTAAEISEQVGFGTVRNFNLKFKEFTGYTPTEYKKLVLQQERES